MSKAKFTPGPWRTGINAQTWVVADNGTEPTRLICRAQPKDVGAEQAAANARLIAAAPAMYEALKECREVLYNVSLEYPES